MPHIPSPTGSSKSSIVSIAGNIHIKDMAGYGRGEPSAGPQRVKQHRSGNVRLENDKGDDQDEADDEKRVRVRLLPANHRCLIPCKGKEDETGNAEEAANVIEMLESRMVGGLAGEDMVRSLCQDSLIEWLCMSDRHCFICHIVLLATAISPSRSLPGVWDLAKVRGPAELRSPNSRRQHNVQRFRRVSHYHSRSSIHVVVYPALFLVFY